jgi:hypothetical protein
MKKPALLFTVSAFEVFLHVFFHAKTRVKRRLPMLEEHLEWANASYYHSSEGTVNSNMHFLPSWPLSVVVAFFCRHGHCPLSWFFSSSWPLSVVMAFFCRHGHKLILPGHAGTLQCAGIVNEYRFF